MARSVKELGSKSYISTDEFNLNFYTYAMVTGPAPVFLQTGRLTVVSGATSLNCPAGRILRENGKKLYPGANSGVLTYMVGVFDMLSGLKGYINPNDPMFAPYNSDRPLYQLDSVYTGNGVTKNLGPSVLTLGNIANSGDIHSASNIVADGNITVGARLIMNSGNTGSVSMTAGAVVGSFRKLTVSAANCRSTSKIMLTYAGQNAPGFLSAEAMTNGSFQIVSSSTTDGGQVMYLIVN